MTLIEDNDHLRELLRQWNEAFGAECYNDALVALGDETEKPSKQIPLQRPSPLSLAPTSTAQENLHRYDYTHFASLPSLSQDAEWRNHSPLHHRSTTGKRCTALPGHLRLSQLQEVRWS